MTKKKMASKKTYTPEDPAPWALKRVPDHLPVPTVCCLCSGPVVVKHHKEVYGKAYGDWPWMYSCTQCDAQVGMHPFTHLPLGVLADKKTRFARMTFKDRFNPLWMDARMDRSEAYRRLANAMGIPVKRCHIGYFSIADCERASQALESIKKAA